MMRQNNVDSSGMDRRTTDSRQTFLLARKRRGRRFSLGAAGAAILLAGCVSNGPAGGRPDEPVRLSSAAGELEIVVRGDLLDLGRDETPRRNWLDRILFGERRRPVRRLRTPQGTSFDGASLYVCDQGLPGIARIPVGRRSVTWMKEAEKRFAAPLDVFSGPSGRVFVVDQVQGVVCTPPLNAALAQPWEVLLAADESHRPVSVAASETTLVIGDARGGRIERIELPTGRRLAAIEYGFGGARIVAPTGLVFAPDGSLLVADAVQGVVHRFDADGAPRTAIGRPGRGEGEFVRPKDVCLTRGGRVVVADAGRQSVMIFDADGRFLVEVRSVGRWPGLTMPGAVCAYDFGHDRGDDTPGLPDGSESATAETVIVVDTLGAPSLVVLELRGPTRGGKKP